MPSSRPARSPAAGGAPAPVRLALAAAAALLLAPGRARPAAPGPDAAPPAGLAAAIDPLLARAPLAGARVAICVVSLDTGATLYAHDADALLNPASNAKLLTVAAALDRLGGEHSFVTRFATDAASGGGPVARVLYVQGSGDPSLVTERLTAIAGELRHLGLRRVGDIVLDDGAFAPGRVAPGFDQEEGDHAYLAPTGALALDHDAVEIHVAPGERAGAPARVEVEPDSAFFEVEDRAVTAPAGTRRRLAISSIAHGDRQRIRVEGRVPLGDAPAVVWRKIDDPPRYLGETLRRLLEGRGVRVTGAVRLGPVPADARTLLLASSPPLAEIVRWLDKESNNFMAEELLLALGGEAAGAPATREAGVAAVEAALEGFGLPPGGYVLRNGSGLNDADRVSARQLVTLLAAAWRRFPLAPEFVGSLPVAGRDGTTRVRMAGTGAAGRIRAKTGTLDGVAALSGYAEAEDGERLAFSILVNDGPPGAAGAALAPAVDAVAEQLVARGGEGRTVSARRGAGARAPGGARP